MNIIEIIRTYPIIDLSTIPTPYNKQKNNNKFIEKPHGSRFHT